MLCCKTVRWWDVGLVRWALEGSGRPGSEALAGGERTAVRCSVQEVSRGQECPRRLVGVCRRWGEDRTWLSGEQGGEGHATSETGASEVLQFKEPKALLTVGQLPTCPRKVSDWQ